MKHLKNASSVSKSALRGRILGGGVSHSDEAADRALVKKMVKPEARTGHAAGGAAKPKPKGKGATVNVVVAPRGESRPVPVPVPVGGAAQAPGPLSPSPAPAPPQKKPMRVVNVPAPQGPLGPLPAKRGGAIKKRAAGGSVKQTGGDNGVGRIEKARAQKSKG
jgi:hypothetical protein